MSVPITTTGTTADPVTTNHRQGESVSSWVSRHNDSVATATPGGNKLTTEWKSDAGNKVVTTTRTAGESDTEFLLRHITAYMALMLEFPPVP